MIASQRVDIRMFDKTLKSKIFNLVITCEDEP
jgi:hypothetical protein